MGLRLTRTGADGGPTDEVGNILGCNGVEELGGGRKAKVGNVSEEAAGDGEAITNGAGAIEPRVHDKAFPAGGGAWFLEIDTHDEE